MERHQATGGPEEMNALTAGLATKSEKIRRLGRAGYSRTQIADYLGIRYQFVRNVLVEEERRNQFAGSAPPTQSQSGASASALDPHRAFRVDVGPGGEIRLPQHILEAAGAGATGHLLVRFDDDEIKLVTPEATNRKIHAWARKHVPEGVSLVDELLGERRREFDREERETKA
ncbi:MAG TPA: hypothetical protein VGL82_11855 [Bryobacteraceae bacterium]|jgi:hypothetical protein